MARNTAGLSASPADALRASTEGNNVESVTRAFGSNGAAAHSVDDEANTVLRWSAGIVVVALVLLALLGGIVFRNANL